MNWIEVFYVECEHNWTVCSASATAGCLAVCPIDFVQAFIVNKVKQTLGITGWSRLILDTYLNADHSGHVVQGMNRLRPLEH
jgi:hypothetical protein